ncbi:hypothetical protein ACFLYX_01650 [Chloroflexota bacterium]
MKRVGYLLLFVMVGLLMPLGIWVAGGSALYQSRKQAKILKQPLSDLTCSIDTDCPAGFTCLSGRCVPEAT